MPVGVVEETEAGAFHGEEAVASVVIVVKHGHGPTRTFCSRPIVGRAMLTTVASSEAIPDPSTVMISTQRPGAEE